MFFYCREVTEGAERSSQLQARLTETRTEAEAEVRQRLEAEWGETAAERDQLESTVEQLRERLSQQQEEHDRYRLKLITTKMYSKLPIFRGIGRHGDCG